MLLLFAYILPHFFFFSLQIAFLPKYSSWWPALRLWDSLGNGDQFHGWHPSFLIIRKEKNPLASGRNSHQNVKQPGETAIFNYEKTNSIGHAILYLSFGVPAAHRPGSFRRTGSCILATPAHGPESGNQNELELRLNRHANPAPPLQALSISSRTIASAWGRTEPAQQAHRKLGEAQTLQARGSAERALDGLRQAHPVISPRFNNQASSWCDTKSSQRNINPGNDSLVPSIGLNAHWHIEETKGWKEVMVNFMHHLGWMMVSSYLVKH